LNDSRKDGYQFGSEQQFNVNQADGQILANNEFAMFNN